MVSLVLTFDRALQILIGVAEGRGIEAACQSQGIDRQRWLWWLSEYTWPELMDAFIADRLAACANVGELRLQLNRIAEMCIMALAHSDKAGLLAELQGGLPHD